MAEELPKITCANCGHTSVKRIPKPKKCPVCGKKYVYGEDEKK